MNKVPTAEDIMSKKFSELKASFTLSDMKECMIEFAKLHVEAALEEASKKANMLGVTQHNNNAPDVYEDFIYVSNDNGPDYGYTVNKESIINAYPLENIK